MRRSTHAITVTPACEGWTWTLTDLSGATSEIGFADRQESAMASAWRAARRLSGAGPGDFPEIRVGHPDTASAPIPLNDVAEGRPNQDAAPERRSTATG